MKNIFILLIFPVIIGCGKSKASFPIKLTNEPAFYDEPNKCNLDSLKKLSIDQNKPILLYFTGWAIINCRSMEDRLLADADIHKIIHEKFIPQELYMDDKKYKTEYMNLQMSS